jgi:putative uncharacterized protein (fragment)
MEYKLRDLYKVSNGLSKGGSFFGSGFPFISFSTVFNNFFVPEEINDFVQSTLKEQVTYSIKKGDILITRTSETIDELGMSCVALKDYPTATFNGFCKRLRPLTDKVYPHFIGYYLRTPYFRSNFTKVASLITRASLRNEDLLRFSIELPPIYKQKKIAEILYSYDNLIENNNKRIKLLGQMAENLYKEWFVRFRFPGYEGVTLENGLPKEWEYTKLERLANISTGKCNREDAEEDGAYPLFDRSQEIKRSNVWLKDCEAIIVPGEGTSFIPRYYNGKFNLHQRCYCVEPLEKGMGFFLYQTLMMYRIYFLYVATGATVPSLRLNNFNDFKVLLPKKELCFQYNEIAEKMNDEILLLKNKNELLSKQRDMLLPRLMSGKLEV